MFQLLLIPSIRSAVSCHVERNGDGHFMSIHLPFVTVPLGRLP